MPWKVLTNALEGTNFKHIDESLMDLKKNRYKLSKMKNINKFLKTKI